MSRFLAYAGWAPTFTYGDYDDSLVVSPRTHDEDANTPGVEFVWLDFTRYDRSSPAALGDWLAQRLDTLRSETARPIVVADRADDAPGAAQFNRQLAEVTEQLPGVYVFDQSTVAAELGPRYFDSRASVLSGSPLSDRANLSTARRLGFRWLPHLFGSRVKAIVVDLDGTLFEGVLGEDGPGSVTITSDHLSLHRVLMAAHESGIMLAVASRNDPADVDTFFRLHPELPIDPACFSFMAVGWRAKSEAIRLVAEALRISSDSVLLVDDNPGELAQAAVALPGLHCLYAGDTLETIRALSTYPGLHSPTGSDKVDRLRIADIAASRTRVELAGTAADPQAYIRSLNVELTFSVDNVGLLGRLHELSTKTNQFNTGLRRFSELEVSRYLTDEDRRVVAVSLRDRLSDSGVVGAIFARRSSGCVVIDEIAISCRALGRGVETVAVIEALRHILNELPAPKIAVVCVNGARNLPARDWVTTIIGEMRDGRDTVEIYWDHMWADRLATSAPVHITWLEQQQ